MLSVDITAESATKIVSLYPFSESMLERTSTA
jgi:hypothetical protein